MNGLTLLIVLGGLLAVASIWSLLRPNPRSPFSEPRVPSNQERIAAWRRKGGPRLWRDAITGQLSTQWESASSPVFPSYNTPPSARGALSIALRSAR